jgi:hypothetical protein
MVEIAELHSIYSLRADTKLRSPAPNRIFYPAAPIGASKLAASRRIRAPFLPIFVVVRPAILLLMLTAAIAAQPASIDGTVINHATGQPLSGVHVRLMTVNFGNAGIDSGLWRYQRQGRPFLRNGYEAGSLPGYTGTRGFRAGTGARPYAVSRRCT